MNTDVDRVTASLKLLNEIWARLIEIGIGVWLLWRQLGAVSIAPITIVLGILTLPSSHMSIPNLIQSKLASSERCGFLDLWGQNKVLGSRPFKDELPQHPQLYGPSNLSKWRAWWIPWVICFKMSVLENWIWQKDFAGSLFG
jgi:hypothetical protein